MRLTCTSCLKVQTFVGIVIFLVACVLVGVDPYCMVSMCPWTRHHVCFVVAIIKCAPMCNRLFTATKANHSTEHLHVCIAVHVLVCAHALYSVKMWCVLLVCLNPLKYHMYNKALFSSCMLCRAISSPYTLVCPMS